MDRARARKQDRGPGRCDTLKGVFALPSGSASEPSANLAPRLDRQGVGLPWARRHFIISHHHGKRRSVLVERVGACSRGASAGSRRRIPSAGTAAVRAVRRRSVGGGRRRAGVIGPARRGASGGGPRASATGSGGVSGPQLPCRRCARASAQPRRAKILSSACALDPAVTSRSGSIPHAPAGVFVAWRADWLCVACWIGRRAIERGVGSRVASARPSARGRRTRREHVFASSAPRSRQRKLPRPEAEEGAGGRLRVGASPVSLLR